MRHRVLIRHRGASDRVFRREALCGDKQLDGNARLRLARNVGPDKRSFYRSRKLAEDARPSQVIEVRHGRCRMGASQRLACGDVHDTRRSFETFICKHARE